jgi:REP element-mobilizing transposase RayT
MARALRIVMEGGIYHVVARGNERRAIFKTDQDRKGFISLLGELEERFGVQVGAYVLMDNHYHVLVLLQRPHLSRAFQWLNVTYGMRYNKRYRRSGHLFQGRFGSQLVEPALALEVARYIHLNPIRIRSHKLSKTDQEALKHGQKKASREEIATWLRSLNRYAWSSYGATIGLMPKPKWLQEGWWLEGRKSKYRNYVEEGVRYGISETPWEKVQGQAVIGSLSFFKKVRQYAKGNPREQRGIQAWERRATVPLKQIRDAVAKAMGKPYNDWIKQYGSKERALYFLAARQHGGVRLMELAKEAGIDYMSISQASNRLKKKLEKNEILRKQWETIVSTFLRRSRRGLAPRMK